MALRRASRESGARVYGKLESFNPGGSVKDRIAVAMVDAAERQGGPPGAHRIQGLGAGFVPAVLNTAIYDEVVPVGNDDALATSRRLASEEGILVGIAAGASVWAAASVARRLENDGKVVVAILPDTGEHYLSTALFSGPQAVTGTGI